MKPITLRNLPPQIADAIRRRAREQKKSFTKAAISLLEEGLGLKERSMAVSHNLDDRGESRAPEEGVEFDATPREQRSVDPGIWP